MREAYRTQKEELEAILHTRKLQLVLFCIYTGKEIAEYEMIRRKMKIVLDQLTGQLQVAREN